MAISAIKTPDNSTKCSNSTIDSHTFGNKYINRVPNLRTNTHPLKHKQNYQATEIFVIFYLCIIIVKINGALIHFTHLQSLSAIQGLHEPQKPLKNGSYCLFFNEIYYIVSLIKKLVFMINWLKKDCSAQAKKEVVRIYVRDIQPSISTAALEAFVAIFFYYSTFQEIITSIEELTTLIGYKKSKVKEIIQELVILNLILKRRKLYFSSDNSLVIQLINIEPLSIFIQKKKHNFLATYVGTELLEIKDIEYKTALFKDMHDLNNIIKRKSYRINYDEETSWFLEKLNTGDIIIFTPQIFTPSIRGFKKLPLNLKIFKKAPLPTFRAEFSSLEETNHERCGTTTKVRFSDIYSINGDISLNNAWHKLGLNDKAIDLLKNLESGFHVYFEASVKETNKGYSLDNIHNIREV